MGVIFGTEIKKEDNVTKKEELMPVHIYGDLHGTHLKIGNKTHTYDAWNINKYHLADAEIKQYETMLVKLSHEERVRYLNGLAKRFGDSKPDLTVAQWFEAKVSEEGAVSFNEAFEYKGKEDEKTIAQLKEDLNAAKENNSKLEAQILRYKIQVEEYIEARTRMEDNVKGKFVYDRSKSIELSLRERVVIMTGIMRMTRRVKDEEVSANLRRLIDNGETVNRYMKELRSDGGRPLTDEEKEHVRMFYKEEGLDTSYILDYIN